MTAARTIDKNAVYDIATSFMIHLMVYSVNHGQVVMNTRGCGLVISRMTAQNRQFSIFSGIILPVFTKQFGKTCFLYCYRFFQ